MITVQNVILFCWIIFLLYWAFNWWKVKPTKETKWKAPQNFRWTFLWVVVLILLVTHFGLFPNVTSMTQQTSLLETFSVLLVILGLIVAIAARRKLADNWSSNIDVKKDHKLITTGVYKYVRHPIYTGVSLMGTGTVLASQSLLATIFFICMVGYFIFKIKQEETLLLKYFPKDYLVYMKRTKALIPFIY